RCSASGRESAYRNGTRQGDPLGDLLYNLFAARVRRDVESEIEAAGIVLVCSALTDVPDPASHQWLREITHDEHVNAYHGDGKDGKAASLSDLIGELAELDGLQRLRYTTSHPLEMTEELCRAHRDIDILMPYLHLPVQAGSDRILSAMNRRHTGVEYRRIIDKLRGYRPDLALSGDFIVGFPGETDQDFEDTLQLVRDVEYAQAYSFKYSPRPGTPAAALDGEMIAEEVKSERLARLQELLNKQQLAYNQTFVGKEIEVLLEREGKRDGQLVGRSPYMQSVFVPSPSHRIGRIAKVIVREGNANSLRGELKPGNVADAA
ncbi:MAG: radical SAM protein, partial [Proteobacteria bacterium]|nr:radical SAM protein [Pseudomonadota bacterium]